LITHALYQGTDISPYGIVNINSSIDFSGADIRKDTILVTAGNFGLFPFAGLHEILADPNWLMNHRNKIITDLANTPSSFSGIFMIDYSEFWHAHFDWSDYDALHGYFYEEDFDEESACDSENFEKIDSNYKEDFYNYMYCNNKTGLSGLYDQQQKLDDNSLDSFMKSQWNLVAKTFFEDTISTVREFLPNAILGFFNYPNSIYKNSELSSQAPNVFGYGDFTGLGSSINDDLSWLYEKIDLISPYIKSIRYSVSNEKTPQTGIENTRTQNQSYIKSNIGEAKRIADASSSYTSPILSHIYDIGRLSEKDKSIVNEINENQQVILSNQFESDYVILFANVDSDQQKDEIESRFVSSYLGLSTQGFGFNSLGRLTPPASGSVRNLVDFIDPILIDDTDDTDDTVSDEAITVAESISIPVFEIDNGPGTDPIDGFGIVRYDPGKSSAVGETDGEAYSESEVVCVANSIDGTFEINSELNKYTTVSVDILNPSFINTSYPHYVIEDSFEWINSGMPSHLSQVFHSNMATMGINLTRTNPSDIARVPPHQARYVVPCNKSFYDSFNSTIDYIEESDKGAREIFIPYTNAVAYVESLSAVWVGGIGGLISIDVDTKQINEVVVDSKRTVNIQDLYILDDYIYIIGQNSIYIYSLADGSIVRDPALGVVTNIRCFVKTRNDTFIIGAEDGFYARKSTQDEYQKVVDTDEPVDRIIHPDATIAIAGSSVYYTTDGFSWDLIGVASQELSDISKYRNKIVFATDEGIYDDNGNVYAGRLSLRLNDVFNDLDESKDIIVNSVDSTVLKVLSGLKDGRYIVLDDFGFSVGSIDGIEAIHSVLIVDGENWIFGYDKFAITSEGVVRLLATGETMTNDSNTIGQVI